MYKVVVFAGTTEGYALSELIASKDISVCACVATEYGAVRLSQTTHLTVRTGRMTEREMADFFEREKPELIVDATHPYAVEVTKNIRSAAEEAGISYVRVLRDKGCEAQSAVYVDSAKEAAGYLKETQGNILVTTGSKELHVFTELPDYENRVFARVLSLASVAKSCEELGFSGKNLICMQGPFSVDMNIAMLRQYQCRYLVTKDSGKAGGFEEKLLAAAACGATPVVIGRPPEEEGMSLTECKKFLAERFGFVLKPKVSLVGIGMGTKETLTKKAQEVLLEAQLIIGAKRMVEAVAKPTQKQVVEYRAEEIAAYIESHPEESPVAIVLSGDVGFYSGAKKLLALLGADTQVVCGISSVSYFMGKIGLSWEDARLVSAHGRGCNLISEIRENQKVFAILGTADGVRALAQELVFYEMGEVLLYVGERLSYPEEHIFAKQACELTEYGGDALSVVCAFNEKAQRPAATHGICDAAFLRGKAPMTKEEVRSVSLSKLQLFRDSICYDIGAGTGSVAVEMALRATEGHVYAIEKKEEAAELLLENKKKFCTDNLTVVSGTAPEALAELPAPTHAFIGGSSGKLLEIVQVLLKKNPKTTIVINCITLETISEILNVVKLCPQLESEVVQMNVARAKSVGRYHMMMGENPIYIVTLRAALEEKERRL